MRLINRVSMARWLNLPFDRVGEMDWETYSELNELRSVVSSINSERASRNAPGIDL
jgi:hypothetical protein